MCRGQGSGKSTHMGKHGAKEVSQSPSVNSSQRSGSFYERLVENVRDCWNRHGGKFATFDETPFLHRVLAVVCALCSAVLAVVSGSTTLAGCSRRETVAIMATPSVIVGSLRRTRPATAVHLLPCEVEHNGKAAVSSCVCTPFSPLGCDSSTPSKHHSNDIVAAHPWPLPPAYSSLLMGNVH